MQKTQNWVNSGIYCFNRKVLELIPAGFSDFPKDIFPKIMEKDGLYALPLSEYRCAVDSPERYYALLADYENGRISFSANFRHLKGNRTVYYSDFIRLKIIKRCGIS